MLRGHAKTSSRIRKLVLACWKTPRELMWPEHLFSTSRTFTKNQRIPFYMYLLGSFAVGQASPIKQTQRYWVWVESVLVIFVNV